MGLLQESTEKQKRFMKNLGLSRQPAGTRVPVPSRPISDTKNSAGPSAFLRCAPLVSMYFLSLLYYLLYSSKQDLLFHLFSKGCRLSLVCNWIVCNQYYKLSLHVLMYKVKVSKVLSNKQTFSDSASPSALAILRNFLLLLHSYWDE